MHNASNGSSVPTYIIIQNSRENEEEESMPREFDPDEAADRLVENGIKVTRKNPGDPDGQDGAHVRGKKNRGARRKEGGPKTMALATPPPPAVSEKRIRRIAPHAGRLHLDEVWGAALLRIFPANAEEVWPGSSTADFRPVDPTETENTQNIADDPTVLKLGWSLPQGTVRNEVVDEHSLPEKQRENQCVATMMADQLNLTPRQRWLIEPLLGEVLSHDKSGKQQGQLHLANIVQKAIDENDCTTALNLVTQSLRLMVAGRERYLESRERVAPKAVWTIGNIEVHVIDPSDQHNDILDVLVANRRNHGASMVVLRDSKGHIQIIDAANKLMAQMTNLAVLVRVQERALAGRNDLLPLAVLRQTGTIADPDPKNPRWHFSDGPSGGRNLLNGGEARPWVPATQVILATLKNLIAHAFDEAWMRGWKGKYFPGQ
ncbi:MAG: hypothetical protein HYS52_00960 [Candidatus Wildermuthbacteria bacterium]|nr:hypothetical protein [Candidatus Wildermuthbacteria bacterium]